MPGLVFLLAMFGPFLCCFNTPAAPSADEIWVQKKRVVSDAPEAGFLIVVALIFSCLVLWKAPSGIRRTGMKRKSEK